jgi:diaminohydroxyphosphoribosylaminopyrimidine deaminase/5-amino-6-(5-phosphoribosylamino)uracil reductase
MKQALKLARKGLGKTSPNPMVGAIIVKDNQIIGQGYHQRYGGNHAVDEIIKHKIGKVIIGTLDPNPEVNGKSVAILKQQGIETEVGVLEAECRDLNEAHFKYMTTGRPLVTLKFAQTIDGRIATTTGDSKWISSDKFRRLAHQLRATNDAVMVGIDTVLADNPQLTVRLVKGRNPIRVIPDSKLRIPLDAEVVKSRKLAPVVIVTTFDANEKKLLQLCESGIEVLITPADQSGEIDLKNLLSLLGERNISSVLVEGGAGIITSLLRQNLADKIVIAMAPKIMGKGIEVVGELNIREVNQAIKLSFSKIYRAGEDLVIEARVNHPPS